MLDKLTTEKRNEKTMNLDKMTALELCEVMNEEDAKVAEAVKQQLPQIALIIDAASCALKKGGRLIYTGAGTSGRIGVMDAVECVPTFGVSPDVVIGLIAGGEQAFVKAVEGAEDSRELGVNDLKKISLNENDVVVGIAASGRTPYVIAGLEYANSINAFTASISCNQNSEISKISKVAVEVSVGPEVLTGSTRLKAATAQKLIANMISTGSMVKWGKVYKNLMVDVLMTNEKLQERGRRIVMQATNVDYKTADEHMTKAGNKVKIAIIMIMKKCSKDKAANLLNQADGIISKAIEL